MSALFSLILTGLSVFMRFCAWRDVDYRKQLAERDFIAQVRLRESDVGRW